MSDFTDRTLTAIVRKLADHEGEDLDRDELEDIVDNADSTGFRTDNATIDTDFGEWTVTDDGYALAVEYVTQDLELDPEIFDSSFLRGYMSMSPTDIRVYAVDLADSAAEDKDERDLEDEIDAAPSVVKAQEALDDAETARDDYFRSFEDGYDDDTYDDLDAAADEAYDALEAAKENALEEAREQFSSNYADEIAYELRRDALGWFEEQFGKGEYPKNLLTLDVDAAAKAAVSADGAGMYLSSYDHNEVEVRVNGKFYQCYRTN